MATVIYCDRCGQEGATPHTIPQQRDKNSWLWRNPDLCPACQDVYIERAWVFLP